MREPFDRDSLCRTLADHEICLPAEEVTQSIIVHLEVRCLDNVSRPVVRLLHPSKQLRASPWHDAMVLRLRGLEVLQHLIRAKHGMPAQHSGSDAGNQVDAGWVQKQDEAHVFPDPVWP